MTDTVYADPATLLARDVPQVWPRTLQRRWFGDVALVLFLLAQCLDGVLTYVGVVTYGTMIEANPIIVSLMAQLGQGVGLMSAKIVAGLLGIALHLHQVHHAVAALAAFYLVVAILPWMAILFL